MMRPTLNNQISEPTLTDLRWQECQGNAFLFDALEDSDRVQVRLLEETDPLYLERLTDHAFTLELTINEQRKLMEQPDYVSPLSAMRLTTSQREANRTKKRLQAQALGSTAVA